MPVVCEGILESRARGLLELFQRKGVLPRTLEFLAALRDLDAVRASLDRDGDDLATVNDAFLCACRFGHEAVASLLLERSITLDAGPDRFLVHALTEAGSEELARGDIDRRVAAMERA